MKLGTQIKLPDGRVGTVVYNSIIGVGIKWGLHNPDPKDFDGTDGDLTSHKPIEEWEWEPQAILRDPWPSCEKCGFKPEDCVGREYEILRIGLGGNK